jgi:hypothetical protein
MAIDPAYLGLWVPDVKACAAGIKPVSAGVQRMREDRYLSSQTSSIRQPL